MRLVFAGTPEFAAVGLRSLLQCGHQVVLVLTQPDRPSGRGQKPSVGAVKAVALEHDIALQQPSSLKDSHLQHSLAGLAVDAWVVAAYGLLLPPALVDAPRLGCLNIHASLLPRWRGAAPIQRALMAGDPESGVSIMRMDEGLDTGPVFLRVPTAIEPDDTGGSLHDRLALLGAEAICTVLARLEAGTIAPEAQPGEGACYAAKLRREDCRVNWTAPAAAIERQLRALDPAPGAFTSFAGQPVKLWRAAAGAAGTHAAPGTVLDAGPDGIEVQCADASLVLTELQRAGGRRMPAAEFLRGQALAPGRRFDA